MDEGEDEFDAIFEDGNVNEEREDGKTEAINYKVSMEEYQKVDIFQPSNDSMSTSVSNESQNRASKYQVIASEEKTKQQVYPDNPAHFNCNNHGDTHIQQPDMTQSTAEGKAILNLEAASENAVSENGAMRDQPGTGYQLHAASPVREHDESRRGQESVEEEFEDDVNGVLRKEVPRVRVGTGGDPTEQLLRAKAEWEVVGTIQPGDDSSEEGNASTINVTPLISFNEALAFFQRTDMQPYLSTIKATVQRSGFAALRHFILGPPSIKPSLHEERNLVFAIAKCPFEDKEEVHRRVLQTIYKQLTGSTLDCPRYGGHWEQIGFQGTDPATDLRACGFLGLMTLLHFVMDPIRLRLAKDIYRLSQHETQNFPFLLMSINMTRIALQALREGTLSRECNRRKQVLGVINDFYAGIFLQLHQIWKHQQKTIKDSGFVIKDVEMDTKKNPRGVIKALELYINGQSDKHGDKHGGDVRAGQMSQGPLEFAGVHELEVEDDS